MEVQPVKKRTRREQVKVLLLCALEEPLIMDDGEVFDNYVTYIMNVFKPRKKK